MIQLLLAVVFTAALGLILFSFKKKEIENEEGAGIIVDGLESLSESRYHKKAPKASECFGNMPHVIKMQIYQRYGFYQ